MANTQKPMGLQVWRGGGAYSYNGQGSLYSIPSTDNNAYYNGDVVKAAASSDGNGVSNVVKAAGTDGLRGSVVGIIPAYPGTSLAATPLQLEYAYIPATKASAWYVLVDDDPSSVFAAQDDGITTAELVAASANLNSSLTITNGATQNSLSGTVLLSSSFDASASLIIKLQGLCQIPGNAYGAYATWQCRINIHELNGSYAGV